MKSNEINNSIQSLKSKSQALHTKAQSINLTNGPLISSGQGPYPQIIAGFQEIISTATNLSDQIPGSPPVDGKDADSVLDAFKEFVRVHQVLLHLLTSKGGLFKNTPAVGKSVAEVLRQDKDVIESLSLCLSEVVESKQGDFKSQQQSLNQTLRAAIKAHA